MLADKGESPGRRRDVEAKLSFVENNGRRGPSYLRENLQQQVLRETSQKCTTYSALTNGNSGSALDFGIGELAEEFATLSTRHPSSASIPVATSKVLIVNEITTPALPSNFASTAASAPLKAPIPPPPSRLSHLSPFRYIYRAQSFNSSSVSPPSRKSSTSVSSSSSASAQNKRPRVVRRFEYWCHVLKRRKHYPMCRYCYECFVHMCKESHRPIPEVHDRGMWHGHKMHERGRVTCPHLWSTVCSRCGATREYAHTDDHCPLSRNNIRCGNLHSRKRTF